MPTAVAFAGSLRHAGQGPTDYPYLCLADYQLYVDAQAKVDACYKQTDLWTKKAILNTARVGFFSSDRTILEYAKKVWNLPQVEVP